MDAVNKVSLIRLLSMIHEAKGLDFTHYKEKTLTRRITSRLRKFNITSYDEYMDILNKDPNELNELINALTINLTEFFRNPESFEAIRKIVIPRIIFSKREHRHKIIRAWSCGCSSGDEP